jgi:hypothetical protein
MYKILRSLYLYNIMRVNTILSTQAETVYAGFDSCSDQVTSYRQVYKNLNVILIP